MRKTRARLNLPLGTFTFSQPLIVGPSKKGRGNVSKEYLVVLFPRSRRVMINGEFMGTTNKKLELESGIYEVTLGRPLNFTPEKCDVNLRNTSSLMPMIVEFAEAV